MITQRVHGGGRNKARRTHPSNVRFASRSDAAKLRRAAESDLRRAIDQGEFVVYFQRQVSLDTRRTVGFEALVRRQTPQGELLAPDTFIPLAERTGLMVPLGRLILERACQQLTAIHRHLPPGAVPPWVAVNFSARQLEAAGIVDDIAEVLEATGLDPDLLWIEITETALMDDLERCAATLHRIRALGVHLSIDDFGTGCSSLRRVKLFPIEQLKIDRSFTAGLGIDETDTSIVIAIIALAHSLGMHVVAEGVETVEQRDQLIDLGCDLGQGYFWGKAEPYEQAMICPSGQPDCYRDKVTSTVVSLRPAAKIVVDTRLDQLPSRPREVVCRLAQGERVGRIADAMYLSRSTVRNHLSRAFREFGVSSQEDLLRLLLPPADPNRVRVAAGTQLSA